jgi:hypothetical protein
MKYLKFLFLISLIVFFGKDLQSQKIFRDGYVVKRTGETLSGLVEYSANQDIPSLCIFKRFDIAREVKYSPQEILAFGYKNGNRYESKDLDKKIAFYEVIVTGEIILYRKGSRYYMDKDHHGVVELKNGSITYLENGQEKVFKELPEFLRYITDGKSGSISDKFNLKNEIIPLVTSFNKNSGKIYYVFNRSISEKQLAQKALETGVVRSRFGFISGLNIYILNLKPNPGNSSYLPNPKMEVSPVYGLTYERLLSRKTDRFSIKVDLLYNKQTFYSYKEVVSNVLITRDDVFFNFTGIKIPVLIQYSFTSKRLVPFLNAGLAYQTVIDKNYVLIREVESTSSHEVKTYEYRNIGFHPGEISAVTGLGLRTRIFDNLSLQFQGRIEYGMGLLKSLTPSDKPLKQNSMQATFLLGITF